MIYPIEETIKWIEFNLETCAFDLNLITTDFFPCDKVVLTTIAIIFQSKTHHPMLSLHLALAKLKDVPFPHKL